MISGETTINNNDAATMPFCRALHWRVHNPEEAIWIAASHRARAAEARAAMPANIASFRTRSQALGLEVRADRHDEIAEACEQHAASLQANMTARNR